MTRVAQMPAEDTLRDLAGVGLLATSLAVAATPHDCVTLTLSWLRQTTGAESAEFFLADPASGDAVLTGYQGPYRASFAQVARFRPGEGFPGIILANNQPVVTGDLASDVRFLRPRVQARRFRCYVGVPVGGELRGVLAVATRKRDFPLERTLRLLSWAAAPIGATLQASFYRTAREAAVWFHHSPEQQNTQQVGGDPLDHVLSSVVQGAVAISGADGGAAVIRNHQGDGIGWRTTMGTWLDQCCPMLACPPSGEGCPALAGRGGQALYGSRGHWPPACRQADRQGILWYCVPLVANGGALGLLQVTYQDRAPWPPTRHLRLLSEVSSVAAPAVVAAQDAVLARRPEKPIVAQPDGVPHGDVGNAWRPATPALRSVDTVLDGAVTLHQPRLAVRTPSPTYELEIRCFGPFEVRRSGRLLAREMFGRRKALTLLKILVTYRDRAVPTDALVEWLWPECDPRHGAGRLHAVTHTLREVLGQPQTGDTDRFIHNDRGSYQLEPRASIQVDVDEYLACIRRGRQAEARCEVKAALQEYDAALSLCRGEYLEDEPFAEWCWQEREHQREVRVRLLQRAATLHTAAGNPDQSVDYLRFAIRIDPLREELHQALLRALLAAGRREEAQHRYEALRDGLARELGADPLPETQALGRQAQQCDCYSLYDTLSREASSPGVG
jgi:DNA-binding SARP family transcriptional activator